MKKKVAILFSGRISGKREFYENFYNNIIKPNEKDFEFEIYGCLQADTPQNVLDDFLTNFNPKNVFRSDEKIDFETFEKYPKMPVTNLRNALCMFYSRKKVLELISPFFEKFYLIISTRCDLMYSSELILNNFIFSQEEDKPNLFIPEGCDYGGINDQFAFGVLNSMRIYMSTFDKILKMIDDGIIIHPETLLLHHLKINETKIGRFDFKYEITRNL